MQVIFDSIIDQDHGIAKVNIFQNPMVKEWSVDGLVFNNDIEA
jgi:hypothetical protein